MSNLIKSKGIDWISKSEKAAKYIKESCLYFHWPYCKQRCSYCNFIKFIPKPGKFWTYENTKIEDLMVSGVIHML